MSASLDEQLIEALRAHEVVLEAERAEHAQDALDAARYRYLRQRPHLMSSGGPFWVSKDALDEDLDLAIASLQDQAKWGLS